jgi:hypothetical protein
MENKNLDFWGYAFLKSNLDLEEVGKILSKKVFGGLPFTGKEKCIHEEIPAIYIDCSFMGMLVILDGYSGFGENKNFTLYIEPYGEFSRFLYSNKIETERVNLDVYLYYLLKQGLQDHPEIQIIEPESPQS